MSGPKRNEHGAFCWHELRTTSESGAKEFYTQLFGWETEDHDMGDRGTYVIFKHLGHELGGMFENRGPQAEGVPPHWGAYVAVDDVDQAIGQAQQLGGSVVFGPHDVFDIGRMAMLSDPQGAHFAIWTEKRAPDAPAIEFAPGVICWDELAARDVDTARDFYTKLFRWETATKQTPGGTYTMFCRGERMHGGMLGMTEEWGDMPSHWMCYVMAADVGARAEQVKQLGGTVCHGPFEVPTVGHIAVCTDPQGAAFSMIQFTT
jgi:hypothetical protein